MSYKTIFNPSRFLDDETRKAILDCGIDIDNYVSTILDKLRMRGEDSLIDSIIEQLESK